MSEMWNSVAGAWDQQADFVDAYLAAPTDALLGAAGIGPGSNVIELACGPGGAGIAAARWVGGAGRVVLADVAPGMVEVAARRSADLPQVSTLVCDQVQIDAPDASFDAVIVRHGLMFVDDPAVAVREARRVLRPGGRYAAMTWDSRPSNPWLGLVLDAVGEQFGTTFPPPLLRPATCATPSVSERSTTAEPLPDRPPMASTSVVRSWSAPVAGADERTSAASRPLCRPDRDGKPAHGRRAAGEHLGESLHGCRRRVVRRDERPAGRCAPKGIGRPELDLHACLGGRIVHADRGGGAVWHPVSGKGDPKSSCQRRRADHARAVQRQETPRVSSHRDSVSSDRQGDLGVLLQVPASRRRAHEGPLQDEEMPHRIVQTALR